MHKLFAPIAQDQKPSQPELSASVIDYLSVNGINFEPRLWYHFKCFAFCMDFDRKSFHKIRCQFST